MKLDPMIHNFMSRQYEVAADRVQRSDILDLFWATPLNAVARLLCTTLVREPDGRIHEHFGFEFALNFSEEWLRFVEPLSVVTVLAPRALYHPNCRVPGACIGDIAPGTEIDDLLYRVFELATWQNFTVSEEDALDFSACQFARQRMDRFPLDARPLLYREGDAVPPTPTSSDEALSSWGTP